MNRTSTLEYFMAHAPLEPQSWFSPIMPTQRLRDQWVSDDGQREYLSAREAERNEGDCFSNINAAEQAKWDATYEKQLLIQWPAAWAKEMVRQAAMSGIDNFDYTSKTATNSAQQYREALQKMLSFFPANIQTDTFSVDDFRLQNTDGDSEFYSAKKIDALIAKLIATACDALAKGGAA